MCRISESRQTVWYSLWQKRISSSIHYAWCIVVLHDLTNKKLVHSAHVTEGRYSECGPNSPSQSMRGNNKKSVAVLCSFSVSSCWLCGLITLNKARNDQSHISGHLDVEFICWFLSVQSVYHSTQRHGTFDLWGFQKDTTSKAHQRLFDDNVTSGGIWLAKKLICHP